MTSEDNQDGPPPDGPEPDGPEQVPTGDAFLKAYFTPELISR